MAITKKNGGALAAALMFTLTGTAAVSTAGAADDKPVIYLSFDDGPASDDGTTSLLDVLDRYDAQATFFINGHQINSAAQRASLVRTLADGHALGSHSYDHIELDALTDAELQTQLWQNHQLVQSVTGYEMACFRSPWGSSFTHEREVEIIEAFGYQIENRWQIDASDYILGSNPRVVADKLATARDGDTILMHDGTAGKQSTIAAVELFLSEHSDDYEFKAIPGCGGTDTPDPEPAPAGPAFDGPISEATTVDEILAASDYSASDAPYLRLYHALLAREPDVAGSKYWLSEAHKGTDLGVVAWSFSQSAEFQAKYGTLSDAQFVTTVYANVLGRTPDVEGQTYWLDQVQSGGLSRHEAVRWIAASPEFATAHPYNPS